jgi:hypothetical protein
MRDPVNKRTGIGTRVESNRGKRRRPPVIWACGNGCPARVFRLAQMPKPIGGAARSRTPLKKTIAGWRALNRCGTFCRRLGRAFARGRRADGHAVTGGR